MISDNIKISLIITTYNNPAFLELVLKSVLSQVELPYEVIVADDGSTDETKSLIEKYQKIFPVKLYHSWIEDKGFRVAKSRNIAISKAEGDYIIIIDGDIVVTRHFIRDHRSVIRDNYFTAGSRARLNAKYTKEHCEKRDAKFSFFSKGLSRRLVMLRSHFLHQFLKGHDGLKNARSCHMAFWKKDFIAVNGFEEKYEGWGYEDSDLVQRFYNYGLKRQNMKLLAPAIHLYHKELKNEHSVENHKMLSRTIENRVVEAEVGVKQYIK